MFSSLREKIIGFIKQGITPQKLALTFALGICLGTIPMLGTTTLLCAAAAFMFRLNLPVIQAVNYLIYPLQLILFIPFLKIGARIFSKDPFNYTLSQITSMLAKDTWNTITEIFVINMYGLLVWLLCTPLIFIIIYFSSKHLFLSMERRLKKSE